MVARRDLEIHELVTFYAGEHILSQSFDYCAAHEHTNGLKYPLDADGLNVRSFGSSIQHSFPNTRIRTLWTLLGPISVIEAVAKIAKGEPLFANYSPSYFRNKQMIELRPGAVENHRQKRQDEVLPEEDFQEAYFKAFYEKASKK